MTLESRYLERCREIERNVREVLGARRTLFLAMIGEYGAVDATRRLLHADQPSDTFVELIVHGRLDLSVEWVVVNERKWDPLFTDGDREAARIRLGESPATP